MTKAEIQQVKQRFGIIGNTEALSRAIDVAIQVAPTDLSVLITGESGVGKESFPQIIHQYSRRKHGQYIAVNCGAIPEGTIDSELFGHEKGAFTGAADGFMGSGNYTHFDGILAMYHDQGLAPFKALAMEDGVNYTAGLPVVRTSPAHGTAYDIAGKGLASEDSFRQAIYVAIDVFRNRQREKAARVNPLRKQYYEKRDDSDKLKLDTVDED